ncbi:uncharacterized protein EV154DRAFT_488256 [Mucor mucedo]|uniref:uncharacterized protein n=1 Tax=Mucor mucedo TaxID=29922 RepID=UPI0022205C90|nr:uncharacterized protein EV154DRAFT_488256 [Mucor mucedo]KAI7867772.1 hypothetical protein EV154DRAFT_488256 [Mucor mucedo]
MIKQEIIKVSGYSASTDLDVEKRQLLLIYKCDKRRKQKCSESDFKGDTNPVLKLCNYQQAPDNIWCQYWFMGSFLVSFPDLDAVIDLPVMILLHLMPQICFMSNQCSDSIFIIKLSAL